MSSHGGNFIMIRKFSVENFKGFKEKITLDFSRTRDYSFNSYLIKNKIVNKGIIYGKNGSGKSNLGFALYDLTVHLTDKIKPSMDWYLNYRNLDNDNYVANFEYEFYFDNEIYYYSYGKTDVDQLIYEELRTKSQTIIKYDYFDKKQNEVNIEGAENLRIDLPDNRLSILKYIYKNTPTNNSIISKIIQFAEGMLWFRCVNEGNSFIGLRPGGASMDEIIIGNNKIKDFESFLSNNGLNYKLDVRVINGQRILYAIFANGEAQFSKVISTGTHSLWLYYCWSIFFRDVTFLFLDEFDAFYHFETAKVILNSINNNSNMQSIVTSHNTYLMKNSITRPDCCFILTDGKITSLSDSTQKEIREAHNLEKMYRNGAFTE